MNTNPTTLASRALRTTAMFLVLVWGSLVYADGQHWEGYDRGEHLKKMTKSLGLSSDQVKTIEGIQKASEPEKSKLKDEISSKKKELYQLMKDDNLDKNKIRSKMEEISKLKIEMRMRFVEDRIQIREVLTAEQRAKQRELMEKHHEKMKDKKKSWDKKKNRD